MKKLLLILLFVVCTLSAKSQARIGYTYNEIKTEFASNDIRDIPTDNGSRLLAYKLDKDVAIFYYFVGDKCNLTIIYTKLQSVADDISRLYDKLYTVVNSTIWKAESRKGTVYAIFNYNMKEDYYTFTWKN